MLVENSIWPIASCFSVLSMLMGVIMCWNTSPQHYEDKPTLGGLVIFEHSVNTLIIFLGLAALLISMYNWWKEVIIEGTYQGQHNEQVKRNLTIGFILFIISDLI